MKDKDARIAKLSSDKGKLEAYTKTTLQTFKAQYAVALDMYKDQIVEKDAKIDELKSGGSGAGKAAARSSAGGSGSGTSWLFGGNRGTP